MILFTILQALIHILGIFIAIIFLVGIGICLIATIIYFVICVIKSIYDALSNKETINEDDSN